MAAGADGVMFMPFGHPYLSDQGALAYFRDVMKELRCPVMIYKKADIPSNELLLNLARDPRVVGVKYAVNNMAQFRQTILADQTGTQWLCGSAERFAPFFMLAGSTGYTTGAGNLCPHQRDVGRPGRAKGIEVGARVLVLAHLAIDLLERLRHLVHV